jgi:hypothetical protein
MKKIYIQYKFNWKKCFNFDFSFCPCKNILLVFRRIGVEPELWTQYLSNFFFLPFISGKALKAKIIKILLVSKVIKKM